MKRIYTIYLILLSVLAVYLILIGIIDKWSRFNEILLVILLAAIITNLSLEKWFNRKKRLEGEGKTENI